jgi:hypothetical protein
MVSIQSLRELDFPSANSMSDRVRKPPKCDSAVDNNNKEFKFEATTDSGKWKGL